jgi:NADPH:quinone reductase-like Zn-dependent oxidoreductase
LTFLIDSNANGVTPMPHIPGAETMDIVVEIGNKVKDLNQGDRVIIYNRSLILLVTCI